MLNILTIWSISFSKFCICLYQSLQPIFSHISIESIHTYFITPLGSVTVFQWFRKFNCGFIILLVRSYSSNKSEMLIWDVENVITIAQCGAIGFTHCFCLSLMVLIDFFSSPDNASCEHMSSQKSRRFPHKFDHMSDVLASIVFWNEWQTSRCERIWLNYKK